MADTFGKLPLPLPAPNLDSAEIIDTSKAYGDPELEVIGDFLKAVLTYDLGAAWQKIDPRRRTVDGPPISIVEQVFTHNPQLYAFEPNALPGLFLYRNNVAETDRVAPNIYIFAGQIIVRWVYPFEPDPRHQARRDTFAIAIGKSIAAAVQAGRHVAWKLDSDRFIRHGLTTWKATDTSPVVLTPGAGLDGSHVQVMTPPRCVRYENKVKAGAYAPGSVLLVTGKHKDGPTITDTMTLTSANGGEVLTTVWQFASIDSIAIDGQVLATGSYALGWDDSPDLPLGSVLLRQAGFAKLRVSKAGEHKMLPIREINPQNNMPSGPPTLYPMVETILLTEELLDRDPTVTGVPMVPSDGSADPPVIGSTLDLLFPDGTLNQSTYL